MFKYLHQQTTFWLTMLNMAFNIFKYNIVDLFWFKAKCIHMLYIHFYINKIYKIKKAALLLLWIWINKTKSMNKWCDKECYLHWIFSVGPDYFFTKNRYSWISHANLAIWWWRSSKVSSRSVFVFACHVIILNNNYSWIFLCYFSNNKKNLLMIYWLYL